MRTGQRSTDWPSRPESDPRRLGDVAYLTLDDYHLVGPKLSGWTW